MPYIINNDKQISIIVTCELNNFMMYNIKATLFTS